VMLLSQFRVYRGYDAGQKRSAADQVVFAKALAAAKVASPASSHAVLDHLDRWLGGEPGNKLAVTRFQQLCAPLAAKAVEDTAFYRYGRLLSRNDVGFDAACLGGSVADFHRTCLDRLETFPHAMLATATHDHKRGEDVRARLAVISEVPDEWASFLARCRSVGRALGRALDCQAPDIADEIMLYQMIVGAWPPLLDPSDAPGCHAFAERLAAWQQKALREAKLRTDWTQPNESYETAARNFLFSRFAPGQEFLPMVRSFVDLIAPAGAVNGLAQTVLKLTVPGMPDFFQGTEFWDFSLVDPDNRRAVDYPARRAALAGETGPAACVGTWRDGRIKQTIIHKLLELRRGAPDLFARGGYQKLAVTGALQDQVVAFTRRLGRSVLVVVVPRLTYRLLRDGDRIELDPQHLHDGILSLPEELRGMRLRSLLSADAEVTVAPQHPLDRLLADFPMVVLYAVDSA
jgi:(1->4)-alpha-D-glucan 1-alpha-D-glucosylmutase